MTSSDPPIDFWVVIGTAAPLLLASSVVIFASLLREDTETSLDAEPKEPSPWYKPTGYRKGFVSAAFIGALVIALSVVEMIEALSSLEGGHDAIARGQAAASVLISMILIIVQAMLSAYFRYTAGIKHAQRRADRYRKSRRRRAKVRRKRMGRKAYRTRPLPGRKARPKR